MKNEMSAIDEEKIIKQAKKECNEAKTTKDEIIKNKKESKKPEIKNDSISLGPLGEVDLVLTKDVLNVFNKLNGVVFKIKDCMFKINYINIGQRRFSAELLNEDKS